MALPFDTSTPETRGSGRAVGILAKTIYRELRQSGYSEREVMALAGEILGLLAHDVRDRREDS